MFGTLAYVPREISTADARKHLADLLFAAARGETVYVMNRGRRVAAIVPVPVAERAEKTPHDTPS